MSLFWYALLCALSSFAIILKRKRELVALLLLPYGCFDTGNVLWLFLAVPWFGLQYVIVVFLIILTYFLLQCKLFAHVYLCVSKNSDGESLHYSRF